MCLIIQVIQRDICDIPCNGHDPNSVDMIWCDMIANTKLMWRDIGAICRDRYESDLSDINVT